MKKVLFIALVGLGIASFSSAQQTASANAPPQYPVVRVGGTLFADYTYQQAPAGVDADGRSIRQNSFNIGRAYVNVNASLSRLISLRITPDVVREMDSTGTATSVNGSYVYRLKFAYVQFNFDDVVRPGSWVKFGLQHTPYLDYAESIYRYRFQGSLFVDREGYIVSADAGLSARYEFPSGYGELVAGVFNGEGYTRSEANDQKAFQIRASLRPAPSAPVLRGLRVAVFWDSDHYRHSDPKERLVGTVTFEHPSIHAGFEYLAARDQPAAALAENKGRGWCAWATPRTPFGLEALLRYESLKPDKNAGARKTRWIGGVAYWFPLQKGIATALLLDYEKVRYENFSPARKTEERYALHTLVTF